MLALTVCIAFSALLEEGCQDNSIASLGSVHLHYLHCVLHSLRFHGSHMISISLFLHRVLHALRGHDFQPLGVHPDKSSPYCNKVAVQTARNAKIRVLNAADIYSKNGERTKGYPLTTISSMLSFEPDRSSVYNKMCCCC